MITLLIAHSLLMLSNDETAPGCCGKPFIVHGEIQHFHMPFTTSLPPLTAEDFAEEVYGKDFVAEVADLKAGTYEVQIALVEGYWTKPGERVMTIDCDGTVNTRVDIVQIAGGLGKPTVLKLKTQHKGGPLRVHFTAQKDNAKFNAIIVRDATGSSVASVRAGDLVDLELQNANVAPHIEGPELYKDISKSPAIRAKDLVRRMSLAEKVSQMVNTARPIPRLGVKAYDWWNEALHGVARAGTATVFPQTIGMAATWDPALVQHVFDVISTEGRAKYRAESTDKGTAIYDGLTFWTPNINLFRDPRWGRGQETYGEDPFLTSEFGSAVVRGLQGPDRNHPKSIATLKHFAVHSGPEKDRHHFDAVPTDDDLYDSYLWHFERVVRDAKPWSIMGAYNRVYGEPACSSTFLLQEQLRDKWGFDGYVVSDCGAIYDFYMFHKVVATKAEASARAVKAGCDLECGNDYPSLIRALNQGLIQEKDIDRSVLRLFEARYRLGIMDSPDVGKWKAITAAQNDTKEHDDLAYRVAQKSQVLLKNNGVLPLAKGHNIAVFGENADSVTMLVGNYNGTPSHPVTILSGIKKKTDATYAKGFPCAIRENERWGVSQEELKAAEGVDTVVVVGGINAELEGEEGAGVGFQGFKSGDRTSIELPSHQVEFVKALKKMGKKVVFVNCSGSAMSFVDLDPYVDAILQAWYPGQRGGDAVADVLFGDFNPCGKLPVTFYKSTDDLPDFSDYSMKNRTHRFFTGTPEYPFGFGLSYATFSVSKPTAQTQKNTVEVEFSVKNVSKVAGATTLPVFARPVKVAPNKPIQFLIGYAQADVPPGATAKIKLRVPLERLAVWDKKTQKRAVVHGAYRIVVGDSQPVLVRL